MEVIGTVMSVAQTLFAALQSAELKEFFSVFGYKSELEDLQNTVSTIKAVFQDAERKQTLSEVEKKLIEDLKDAVYEADDLLDEFVTLSEQKRLLNSDGGLTKKMRKFVSRTNPFGVAYRMSKGVKKIRKKLDAIVDNKRFDFVHDSKPTRKRRPETCSYVNEVHIIGRDKDLEEIVEILSDDQQDLSFLGIYGIGGMGKTALAQLVFNDPRIKDGFPLRLWVCVSDQDQEHLNVKEVLGKILASMNLDEGSTLVEKQSKLQKQLADKRYLLVLDDVWTEKREEWCGLVQYLAGGQRGNWIVVTTRSQRTATIIGDENGRMYELQGLLEEDSWCLFKRAAFGSDESNLSRDDGLVKLGRDIINGCAQVPLAIRVVGSLLYRQDKSKWESVKKIGFSNFSKKEDGIMSVLQLSYHYLESPLKSCFAYCALFPKDFVIDKEMLVNLWVAQGYVVPFYDGQSVEDAGEEYFSILLKRCFFQDIRRDEDDEIVSCKMHDLIHDIAQCVSRKEIYTITTRDEKITGKIRHFSIPIREYSQQYLNTTHTRSYIHLSRYSKSVTVEDSFVEALLSRFRVLRALDLSYFRMRTLPNSLGALLHLRFLDLSYNNYLRVLPKSISKLHNLQVLKLKECSALEELPKDLSKLVNLRALDISFCYGLKYMPQGLKKLTCLYSLSDIIVGSVERCVTWKKWFDGLQNQEAPNSLKGELKVHVKWPKFAHNVVTEENILRGCILRHTEHLNGIKIYFVDKVGDEKVDDERRIAMMEVMHPHPNIKNLDIVGYRGTRMPAWVFLLPNLVNLVLHNCFQLKEWKRGVGDSISSTDCKNEDQWKSLPSFPQLTSLKIWNSPELTWIPPCPKLKILDFSYFNRDVVFRDGRVSISVCGKEVGKRCEKLQEIRIDNVVWLNSLPMATFQCLEELKIWGDEKVEKLGEIEEVFCSCCSSLRSLKIQSCDKLRSVVSKGLDHLTALEVLLLYECENLNFLEEEKKEGEDGGITPFPCPSLLPSLRELSLWNLPKMENLPNWMQYLTALHTLDINDCRELKAMPNWMPKLTSLRLLSISRCSENLKRRCKKDPQGEDWPFIQHINVIRLHSFPSDSDI